ncbi:MAG TPA: flagellar filament capping protein FliD, partial [Solirubrobacteraceae bacterium]
MSSSSVNSSTAAPINITGLASGLNTNEIISALLSSERAPVTRLTGQQERLQGDQQQLQSIQNSLQALSFSAAEFSLPSTFETSQTVTSSEPTRVSATSTTGAGVGGYEVEVTQLANSAQRTFTFKSPASEDTINIDGQEIALEAGATAQDLASAINSDSKSTVYAAALENGTVVLSNRATGNTGSEFIKVTDPGETLVEKAGTAKEGRDAEYKVDGVSGTSKSNTVSEAIPGVTLSLNGLTTTGPVTVDVQAPTASTSLVQSQIQSFITLYNS